MAASRRAAFGFIVATGFLDSLSFGLIFPVLPRLVMDVTGEGTAAAARWFGIMAGGWALANFFAAPLLGALSDRFGRRPVLVVSAFGFAADLVVMALAPSVAWLVAGRIISGFTAGNFAAASAYIADITEPQRRAARFGVFGAVYGAGMVLGPAFGGLLGQIGPRAPFWVAAALAGAMALYGLLVLPESLPREKRGPMRGLNPFAPFGVLMQPGQPRLALITILLALAGTSANTIFVLYVDYRYGWGVAEAGLLLTIYSAGTILVMGLVTPRMVRWAGEWFVMVAGLTLSTVGFAALALAGTPFLFALACVPTCVGNMCGPPLRALHTNLVSETEQGRLQGALGGLQALAGLVGPVVFTQMFAISIAAPQGSPGFALLMGSGLLAIAIAVALTVPRAPKPA